MVILARQVPRAEWPLAGVLCACLIAASGCRDRPAREPEAAAPRPSADAAPPARQALGRAAEVTMDAGDFRSAIDEARALQVWRTGKPAPIEALRDPMLRRRVLTKALETRVIREEALRRGVVVAPDAYRRSLSAFAAGRPLDSPPAGEIPDDATLDAGLAARYGGDPAHARQVVVDLLYAAGLATALTEEVEDATLRRAWEDEKTHVRLDLIQIPRVPATAEITQAVATRAEEIAALYAAQKKRFVKPERVSLRRILVAVPKGADREATEAARRRAEALRARIEAGETFEAVASAESDGRGRRHGGRTGAIGRGRAGACFDLKPGIISPVLPHPRGWQICRLETRIPASERPLDDPTVQRELAAEILRRDDDLPHARAVAEQVRGYLQSAPTDPRLSALVASARLTRKTSPPFDRAGGRIVPGIGLAPALFDAAFALTPQAPVSAVITVRQHYVVARLVERDAPAPEAWSKERADYAAMWRKRERPFIVNRWLSKHLRGKPLWVDSEALNALDFSDLGVGPAVSPK